MRNHEKIPSYYIYLCIYYMLSTLGWQKQWYLKEMFSSNQEFQQWRRQTWRKTQQWTEQSWRASYLQKNVIENIYQIFLQKILINCIIKSQREFSKSSTHVFLSSFLVQTLLFHYPCQGYSNQCFYSRSPQVRHRAPPVLVLACHFHWGSILWTIP